MVTCMEGEPVSREAIIVRYTMARSSETLVRTISPPGAIICHPQIQQHMHIVPEIPAKPCGSGAKFLGFGDIIWGLKIVRYW